jgi:PAS domain-containing protein
MDSLDKVGDARSLAQVVIEAIREPLLVLDEDFRILAASDSFHETFQFTRSQTFHHPFFTMGDGAWDIRADAVAAHAVIVRAKAKSLC